MEDKAKYLPNNEYENRLLWILYDMMKEGYKGTYYYNGGQLGEIVIKI